ncbi:MAG TPA: peptidoglycan-associated lipoprotein Pal [Candidatus Angelobacter sp.]
MNYTKKHLILGIMLSVLGVLAVGCKKEKKPPPPPPPPAPVTATLSANPATIQSGQSSTLTWSTQNATDITLDGNKVDASGSQSVSPRQTTTYHLVAKGAGGTQDAPATVTVIAPPPPPTPTPTPAPSLTDDQIFAQALSDVYFDYDKADLRPEGQQMLARAAQVIAAHGNWTVRIEGNCDERGSTEYNLALGERRASAAQQALAAGGVSASQLKTVSYGKEKPVCTESTEDCWQRNRRDHFVLVH